MLERLLLGLLALGLPDQSYNWSSIEENAVPSEKAVDWTNIITRLQNSARLRVGMLSISLIISLAVGGYVGYSYWIEKTNYFSAYVRNLAIALACRTFFSILFDGVVILGSNSTVAGANALLAFECICQNLVIAFWLLLTIYLHARLQRKFNSEPTLIHYEYGVPGIALFFAFIWIFGMQAEYPNFCWLFILSPLPQWIVGSLRLLYLLIQLGLVLDMGRIMMKISLDNDSLSLLRKTGAIIAALVLLFWLQFGLSLGRLPLLTTQSYQYFDSFIDGGQPGLVCAALLFFNLWVPTLINKIPNITMENQEAPRRTQEVLITDGRGIETVDKVFRTSETGRWKNSDAVAESRDVMYSSVVEPQRLKKTLDLYKRLNVLPSGQKTILNGEEFYDCRTRHPTVSETGESEKVDFRSVISDDFKDLSRKNSKLKAGKLNNQVQKKNAFYASKYLILDPKEIDFPKFLETRPSVSSVEKESTREDTNRDFFPDMGAIELVNKWLDDNSENLRGEGKPRIEKPSQQFSEAPEPIPESKKDFKTGSSSVQGLTQQADNQENTYAHQKSAAPIEPSKDPSEKTLILTETKILQAPILRKYFRQAFKRKHSETEENNPPNNVAILESSSEQIALEAVDPSDMEDPTEVHEEVKRRKSTQHRPEPGPLQMDTTSSGRGEDPSKGNVCITESQFTPEASSSTLVETLPAGDYSEPPKEKEVRGFSDVIYSTFTSLLNLDGFFKSRNSVSTAETDLQVPSEWQDILEDKDMHVKESPTGIVKNTDLAVPVNTQNLDADTGPINCEAKITENEIKSSQDSTPLRACSNSFEEQSLKVIAQETVEEQEKPFVVPRRRQNFQKKQPEPAVSKTAESVGDESSSESNFSVEKAGSPSFSLDEYYAGLKATEEKITSSRHPFTKKSVHY